MKKYKKFAYFVFYDDIFTLDKKWLEIFLREYQKIGIPFTCNIRVENCTKETFRKLKESGCVWVGIGVESGNWYIRKKILKRLMPQNQIRKCFQWAKEFGLKTFAYVMVGLPEENRKRFLETVKLVSELETEDFISVNIFHPYPGTKLFKYCKKKKLFREKIREDYLERSDTILNIPTFPRKDILHYYNNFYYLVNLYKRKSDLLTMFHNKILFLFLSTPPSSPLFPICKIMFDIDRKFISAMKRGLNFSSLKFNPRK